MNSRRILIASAMLLSVVAFAVMCSNSQSKAQSSTDDPVKRGAYLVNIGGCNDCHSPKVMTALGPVPDTSRLLSGQPADEKLAAIPDNIFAPDKWGAMCNNNMTAWAGPWGISYAANLTPDQVTGIGAWNETVFIQAMRNGKHMGAGRPILPPMPWQNFGKLDDSELKAIFAYLQSIKPIENMVPPPAPPAMK